MRELSTTLTTAQESISESPLYKVVLSRSGQTTRGYDTSRIIKVSRTEEPNSHKAEIILHNADGAMTSLNFEHYQAVISKGYATGVARSAWVGNTAYAIDDIRRPVTANGYQYRCSVAGTSHATTEPTWPTDLGVTVADNTVTWEMDGNSGDEYSRAAPLRGRIQETYSGMGIARCILRCIGLQDQLKEDKAIAEYTQESTDANTVKTLITAICNASTNLSSAYNGYTVITVVYDSEDSLIDSFKPADYFSISMNENRWDKITELLSYTRCKARFENDAKLHIFVPRMTSKTWVANTAYVVNDYVQPVTPNDNFTYQCTTAGTSGAGEPAWPTTDGSTVGDGAGALVWTARTFHYEYKWNVSGDHLFWNKSIRLRFINPNKVIVRTPSDYATQYTGNAVSTDSNALAEKTKTVYARLVSNAQCTSIASAMIEQLELDDEKGVVTVPPNVGQELWDYVKVTDSILGDNNIGNVQYISDEVEVFPNTNQRPTWRMLLSFGKVTQQSLQIGTLRPGEEARISNEQIQSWLFRLMDIGFKQDARLDFIEQFLSSLKSPSQNVVMFASVAQTSAGLVLNKAITPNSLAVSIYGERIIYLKVIADDTALTTGDGKMYFTIPDIMNGWKLIDADASVVTVSTSGLPTIQINNVTQAADMLTTRITIDANEKTSYTAATAPVIDAANDDVATGDELRIDVDVAGTGTKGLNVILTFLADV